MAARRSAPRFTALFGGIVILFLLAFSMTPARSIAAQSTTKIEPANTFAPIHDPDIPKQLQVTATATGGDLSATSVSPDVAGHDFTAAFDCGAVTEIPSIECQALAALYTSTNGAGWMHKSGWLATSTPCNWYGVSCSAGHISILHLGGNQLSGSIPPELGNLINLQELWLDVNLLSGSIPPQLGALTNLQSLLLSSNQLSGSIPPELGNLHHLQHLYLRWNQLSGSIPPELGTLANLQQLLLRGNQLNGSIPSELSSLTNLQSVSLNNNQLSGSIPPELGNLTNLQDLGLSSNQLSGRIPPELGNLTNLQWLELDTNPLSGDLPQSLKNRSLITFTFDNTGLCEPGDSAFQAWLAAIWDLYRTGVLCTLALSKDAQPSAGVAGAGLTYTLTLSNMITDTAISSIVLTDTLPVSVTLLSADPPATSQAGHVLQWDVGTLTIGGIYTVTVEVTLPATSGRILNQASATGQAGSLLTTQAQFTTDVLDLCADVTEIPKLECQALVALYNSTNGSGWWENSGWLTTNTPCDWYGVIQCDRGHVTALYLADNQLSGSIPPELSNLNNLWLLTLHSNHLSGSIPPELGSMANLQELYLFSNELSGSIPPELGNSPKLWILHLDSNQLSGSIPPQLGNLANLGFLLLDSNQLSGSIPPELGNLVNLIRLNLSSNQLSGSIPPELGNLANLWELYLSSNQLSGGLPQSLRNLSLGAFSFNNTNLCEPGDSAFQGWLAGIGDPRRTGAICTLALSKNAQPSAGVAGAGLTYTLTLSNMITDTAISSIVLTDTLPVSVTMLSADPPATSQAGHVLQWDVGTLPAGGSYTVTLGVALPATPGRILNQASATGQAGSLLTTQAQFTTDVFDSTGAGGFCDGVTEIPVPECQALAALYNSTNGAGWWNNSGWLATDTPCSWSGVTCSAGHVDSLNLWYNGLSGSIPPELGNLANLQELYLDSNQLSGSIPPELGNLANLQHLCLDSNQLSGSIPPELGNLGALQRLWLDSNQLSGSIPPELGNLANLRDLRLESNPLSGGIPPELGNLANVEYLVLGSIPLGGSIPPELGNLANLQYLTLEGTELSGSIPPELGNLAKLAGLSLYSNYLSGSIPPELGNLTNLRGLYLQTNQLSGSIPPELGNLANLQGLGLNNNQLTGSIPLELGNLANLQGLDLAYNQLSGSVPPELGNLANLQELYLDSNRLSGGIPPELGNLANLEYLSLSINPLSGGLPQSLTGLHLIQFWFGHTALCEPGDSAFQAWLAGIGTAWRTGILCASGVAIDGPSTGFTGIPYPFSALVSPISATLPITYTWEATGQAAITHGSIAGITDSIAFFWPSTGPQAITVTAANLSNSVTGVYTITIAEAPATYTITGRVTGPLGAGLAGVNLAAGGALTATANASGFYTVTGATAGTYVLTPTLSGFAFSPVTRTASVPPDAIGQDFTAALTPVATAAATVAPTSSAMITLPNNWGQIALPAGFVTTTTTFTYSEFITPTQAAGGFAFAGASFTLIATDAASQPITTFTGHYTITLNYSDADWQAAGIPAEENLNLYYWNGSTWVAILPCAGCSLDTVNNRITAVLDHLTEFALLGSPLAAPAVSAAKVSNGIELTWLQIGGNITGYEVYRSGTPYFTPDASNKLGNASAHGSGAPANYTDETLTDPLAAYFYVVRASGDGGAQSPASNRVGVFRFSLTPGAQ